LTRQTKGPEAALQLVEGFARKNSWHYGAAVALGRLYAQKGDVPRAEVALRHASWLDVHDAEALNLIASMSLRQNHLEDAYRTQCRAVARQPDEPRQYVLLSNILEKMGRPAEAKLAGAEVTRLESLARLNGSLVN
jgi:Flp pilus assembly protein TadD